MIPEQPDSLLQRLAQLPSADVDERRRARVLSRCHAALERRRTADVGAARSSGFAGRAIELVLVAGFCVAYLSIVVLQAWQMK